jgi:hypothetical protein
MRRVPHSWREAYELALIESDPSKLIGRIEYALNALERRYAEWGTDPGTPAELTAIQECISTLERLMKQKQLGRHRAIFLQPAPGGVGTPGIRPKAGLSCPDAHRP